MYISACTASKKQTGKNILLYTLQPEPAREDQTTVNVTYGKNNDRASHNLQLADGVDFNGRFFGEVLFGPRDDVCLLMTLGVALCWATRAAC